MPPVTSDQGMGPCNAIAQVMGPSTALLLGRRTCEVFAPFCDRYDGGVLHLAYQPV